MLLKALFDAILGDALTDAYDKVKRAQRTLARCISEQQFNYEMCNFYQRRMKSLDPHSSVETAFAFAEAYKSHTESFDELQYWSDRSEAARAALALRTEQYEEMLK